MRAPARAINWGSSRALLRQIVFAISYDFSGLAENQIRMDERIEIAIQHTVHISDREFGAVVLDHAVGRENVAADLAAEVDIQLRGFSLARFLALLFHLEFV